MTEIVDAKDLLAHGELVDVRYTRLSAETLEKPRESFESDDVEQTLFVSFGSSASAIEVRAEVTIKTRIGEYRVEAATQFRVEGGFTFTESVVVEFAEKIGVMAIYPYLREGVQSLTSRLHESPVTMPLLKQATLVLREEGLPALAE